MAKIKTLTEQGKSSQRKRTLKSWRGIKIHHPEKTLLNERLFAESILECLKENDTEALMEIIDAYLSVLNKTKFARENKVPRRTLYHSIRRRNPTIKTLAKIIHSAYQQSELV